MSAEPPTFNEAEFSFQTPPAKKAAFGHRQLLEQLRQLVQDREKATNDTSSTDVTIDHHGDNAQHENYNTDQRPLVESLERRVADFKLQVAHLTNQLDQARVHRTHLSSELQAQKQALATSNEELAKAKLSTVELTLLKENAHLEAKQLESKLEGEQLRRQELELKLGEVQAEESAVKAKNDVLLQQVADLRGALRHADEAQQATEAKLEALSERLAEALREVVRLTSERQKATESAERYDAAAETLLAIKKENEQLAQDITKLHETQSNRVLELSKELKLAAEENKQLRDRQSELENLLTVQAQRYDELRAETERLAEALQEARAEAEAANIARAEAEAEAAKATKVVEPSSSLELDYSSDIYRELRNENELLWGRLDDARDREAALVAETERLRSELLEIRSTDVGLALQEVNALKQQLAVVKTNLAAATASDDAATSASSEAGVRGRLIESLYAQIDALQREAAVIQKSREDLQIQLRHVVARAAATAAAATAEAADGASLIDESMQTTAVVDDERMSHDKRVSHDDRLNHDEELVAALNKVKGLEDQLVNMTTERDDLLVYQVGLKSRIAALERECERLNIGSVPNKEVDTLRKELDSLQFQLASKTNDAQALETKLQRTTIELMDARDFSERIQSELGGLRSQLEGLMDSLRRTEKELEMTRNSHSSVTADLEEARHTISCLEEQLKEKPDEAQLRVLLKKQQVAFCSKIKELRQVIVPVWLENTPLDGLTRLQRRFVIATEELITGAFLREEGIRVSKLPMALDAKDLQTEIMRLEGRLDIQRAEMDQLRAECAKWTERAKTAQASSDDEIRCKTALLDRAEAKITELEKKLAVVNEELCRARQQQPLEKKSNTTQQLQRAVNNLKIRCAELEQLLQQKDQSEAINKEAFNKERDELKSMLQLLQNEKTVLLEKINRNFTVGWLILAVGIAIGTVFI